MQLMIISNHKDFKHVLVYTINNNLNHFLEKQSK